MSFRDRFSPTGRLPWPDDSPEGLAARWVRWLALSTNVSDPVRDNTGEYAARNQPGDVFFLAGTYGGGVIRDCWVPAGRALFFPVLNAWGNMGSLRPRGPQAETVVDGVDHPVTEIHPKRSFPVAGPWRNPVTGMRWPPTQIRVWGLWSYVPALAPGSHMVCFRGGADGFGIGATYRITVA